MWVSNAPVLNGGALARIVTLVHAIVLGVISCRSGSPTCWRRHRFRNAMATARLAASCPTMCLLSSWTISDGVMRNDMGFPGRKGREKKTAAHLGAAVQFYAVRCDTARLR